MADNFEKWAMGETPAPTGKTETQEVDQFTSWATQQETVKETPKPKQEKKKEVPPQTAAEVAKAVGYVPEQSYFRRGVTAGAAAIPSLLTDGVAWLYQKATGQETNFGQYGKNINEFLGIKPLEEDASTLERGMYYAGETIATLGRGTPSPAKATDAASMAPMIPASPVTAMKEAALSTGAKRLGTEAAVGTAAGFAGEYNPYLGLTVGLGGGMLTSAAFTGSSIGTGEDIAKGMDDVLGRKYGISTTKGMRLLDDAYKETDPVKQSNKISEALHVLRGEQVGRTSGGKRNVSDWRLADEKRSRESLAAIEKLAGIHSLNRQTMDGTDLRDAIVEGFESWSKARIASFTARNKAAYDKVDGSLNFNTQPTVDALDNLAATTDSEQLAAAAKAFKRQFLKTDDKGEVIGAADMTLETIRRKLSALGNAAYKGEKLKDMPVGISSYDARQLQKALQQTLDVVDDSAQGKAAKALREANKEFKAGLASLEKDARYKIVDFFEKGGLGSSPEEMTDFILMNASDRNQVTLMRSIMEKKSPELFGEVRQYMMHKYLDAFKDPQGKISFANLAGASQEMSKNAFFFGDDVRDLNKAKEFFEDMQTMYRALDPEGLAEGNFGYMAAKAGAEALGAMGGAKGRYVGELGVKARILQKFGIPSPEEVAVIANNPDIADTLTKYVRGDMPLMGNDVAEALNKLDAQAARMREVNSFTATLMRSGAVQGEQRAVEEQQRSGSLPPAPFGLGQ